MNRAIHLPTPGILGTYQPGGKNRMGKTALTYLNNQDLWRLFPWQFLSRIRDIIDPAGQSKREVIPEAGLKKVIIPVIAKTSGQYAKMFMHNAQYIVHVSL